MELEVNIEIGDVKIKIERLPLMLLVVNIDIEGALTLN